MVPIQKTQWIILILRTLWLNPLKEANPAFGILLCGTANGVAITANKHQGIRAAICWGEELAKLAREHNNANIICIPARFVREGDAEKMVNIFMSTAFEGGRHETELTRSPAPDCFG